ncbi:MAG: hypothetical protein DYG98_19155 [Haliscomenobacteraceae bacterium CHB4]|nr:hypothetical protein [Saprospiraceae bacterium]MCE7925178.1 hypothetical protein [Haliscomenobacteraceae bacterium CHB4]
MSALNSGMDILIEISSDFILRVFRKRLIDIDQGCFAANEVLIPNPSDPEEKIPVAVRRAGIFIEDVSFEHSPSEPVFINLDLRLLYAQVDILGSWKSLGELELEAEESRDLPPGTLYEEFHSFSIDPLPLLVSVNDDLDQIVISVDTSSLPPEIGGIIGDGFSFPINFLNKVQVFQDEAGISRTNTILALTINGNPEVKALGENCLVMGLDVQLSQDEDLMVFGPEVDQDADPLVAGPENLIPHRCGLPSQPAVDLNAFQADYEEVFLDGSDWAIALDAHVIDAVLRGRPSTGINKEGEGTEDCEYKDARRSFCLKLEALRNNVINVRGSGAIYICTPDELFFIPNDFYEIEFEADITMRIENGRLEGQYTITDISIPLLHVADPDPTEALMDLFDVEIPAIGSLDPEDFPTRFGERDDPLGRLVAEAVEIRPEGLVLRGSSSVRPAERSISAPDTLLFATGCFDPQRPSISRFQVRNTGSKNLHLCPVSIRKHPDGGAEDAGFFRVISPNQLLDDGTGQVLRPNRQIDIEIECSRDPGSVYLALLDIPNDAQNKSVTLDANFNPVALGPTAEELDFGHIEYEWSGCSHPPDRSVVLDLEIVNEGPGHMEICSIELSEDLGDVFKASNPGIFAAGTAIVSVTFSPPWGKNRVYNGTMRMVTNGGEEQQIRISGQVTTHEDDPWGVVHHMGFDRDKACADADWDRVEDTDGRILDVHEVERLLPFLGGEDCCPPLHSPACRCVDLWEIDFLDVPFDVRFEVRGVNSQLIATNLSHSPTRTLLTPIREENEYSLHAKMPRSVIGATTSRVTMRRWLVQQDGLYVSRQRLGELAVVGEHAYAVGPEGMEVISLNHLKKPKRVALVRSAAGATTVAAFGKYLLVNKNGLFVYGLTNPAKPSIIGKLSLPAGIRTFHTANNRGSIVYGIGNRIHILDLADPEHPKKRNSISIRVKANQALQKGNNLYLFGKRGMEVLDLSKPEQPKTVGCYPARKEIQNAFLTMTSAILIYDNKHVESVDISKAGNFEVTGKWNLEAWMSEFIPLSGRFSKYKKHFLILTGDQRGVRVMRIRPNKVDQAKLRQKRGQV